MDDSKRANAPTPSATTAPDSICATHSVCSRSFTDCTATGTSRETASGSRSHSASSNATGAESGLKPSWGREPNSPSRCQGERPGQRVLQRGADLIADLAEFPEYAGAL